MPCRTPSESYVTVSRTEISDLFAREAWRLLEAHYEQVLAAPDALAARGAMLIGAHEAGLAIDQSMLGATHACANPLTAHYGTTHGVAIAVMLPHVVRWNAAHVGDRYGALLRVSGRDGGDEPGERLATRLEGAGSVRRPSGYAARAGRAARRPVHAGIRGGENSGPAHSTHGPSMPPPRSHSTSRHVDVRAR